ncbi:MAG: AAA family ATPase [Planctomycetes bacterium]|nr:AAA family ATPase [Planctomycetota bacterium]
MRRIAIINQKGGVGKTTTVANLGAALARAGKRVVVFDMDPQANLSLYLGSEVGRGDASVYGVLTDGLPVEKALRKTNTEGLLLVASHLDLSGAELELASAMSRETLLRDAINLWEAEALETDGFPPADYILLDCPPSLGLLSINALVAAEEVMIAVQTEFFALQGLSKLVEVIQLLRRRMNPALTLTGILPCLYDSRLKLAREVLAELRRFFPGKVYRSPVRSNVRLAESPSHGQTIFEYAPGSNGAKDYQAMGEELLRRSPTEERPAPSQVEVVNDDQAKELHRAAEGLRDLEAPTPEHRNAPLSKGEPSSPETLEAPEPIEEVDSSLPEEAPQFTEPEPEVDPIDGGPVADTTTRANDGVDAELATYELPRIKPENTQVLRVESESAESPQASGLGLETPPVAHTLAPESLGSEPVVENSLTVTPEAELATPGEALALEELGNTATATLLEDPETSPSIAVDLEPEERVEDTSSEPVLMRPKPTPVMGFANYIGEDRWTRKSQQNQED